jgi:ABC-type transport system involved in multi-copper enzyme maturation permease subunit
MIWLTWRQFRTQAATVYAAVAAIAVVLAITGPRLLELSRAYPNAVFDQLTRTDRNLYGAGLVVMAVAPAVIGAFWGAPMVARELEAGTHRLAWNQTVTRTRWLATKLGITALAAAAAVGVLTLAVSWWAGPLDGALSSTHGSLPSRLTPVAFAMRGVAPVGYAVFALVLGVAAGIVLRRTVPAMAVTLALFTFVQIAVPLWVRPHLVPPVRQTVTITGQNLDGITLQGNVTPVVRLTVNTGDLRDWVLSNRTADASGRPVDALPPWMADCLQPPSSGGPRSSGGPGRIPAIQACLARLTDLGYRQRVVYQPVSRFWALQWAETALFLALSGLLTGFCFWWTRRRLA